MLKGAYTAKGRSTVEEAIAAINDRFSDGFDLVIASDVMYDSQRYPELWSTLERFAGSSAEAKARSLPPIAAAAAGWAEPSDYDEEEPIDEEALLDAVMPSSVAILGFQIRNGAERRFGEESEEYAVLRTDLPQPSKEGEEEKKEGSNGRNPTGKHVAYIVRRDEAEGEGGEGVNCRIVCFVFNF